MIIEVLGAFKLLADCTNGALAIWKSANGKARRQEIGAWLNELGLLIDEVARSMELGQYPHASCAKMDYILDRFDVVVGDAIDDATRHRLLDELNQARNIERMFGELQQMDNQERTIRLSELKASAGTLQGAGSVLKNM